MFHRAGLVVVNPVTSATDDRNVISRCPAMNGRLLCRPIHAVTDVAPRGGDCSRDRLLLSRCLGLGVGRVAV